MYLKFEGFDEFYDVLIFDFQIFARYEELSDSEQFDNMGKVKTDEEIETIKDHWKIFKHLFPETYKKLKPFFEKEGISYEYGYDVKIDNDDIDEFYDAEAWQYIKDFE